MKKFGVIVPEILTHIRKKPVTILYPFVKVTAPEGFRGTPRFKADRCTGCMNCVKDCTAEAIEIFVEKLETKEETPKETPKEGEVAKMGETAAEGGEAKKKRKCTMTLYLDRCVHCARCAEVCPRDAIVLDREFEIASFTRAALKLVME